MFITVEWQNPSLKFKCVHSNYVSNFFTLNIPEKITFLYNVWAHPMILITCKWYAWLSNYFFFFMSKSLMLKNLWAEFTYLYDCFGVSMKTDSNSSILGVFTHIFCWCAHLHHHRPDGTTIPLLKCNNHYCDSKQKNYISTTLAPPPGDDIRM